MAERMAAIVIFLAVVAGSVGLAREAERHGPLAERPVIFATVPCPDGLATALRSDGSVVCTDRQPRAGMLTGRGMYLLFRMHPRLHPRLTYWVWRLR